MLVIGCIKAKFCKRICVGKLSPRSTQCTHLHRSLISKFSLEIAEFFAVFPKKFANFAGILPIFDQNLSGFFQNAAFLNTGCFPDVFRRFFRRYWVFSEPMSSTLRPFSYELRAYACGRSPRHERLGNEIRLHGVHEGRRILCHVRRLTKTILWLQLFNPFENICGHATILILLGKIPEIEYRLCNFRTQEVLSILNDHLLLVESRGFCGNTAGSHDVHLVASPR